LHVDLPVTVTERSSSNRRTAVEVDVNDRVNVYVAVKLQVWVDVEVLVEGPRSDHDRPEALGYTRLEKVDQNRRADLARLRAPIVTGASNRVLIDPAGNLAGLLATRALRAQARRASPDRRRRRPRDRGRRRTVAGFTRRNGCMRSSTVG